MEKRSESLPPYSIFSVGSSGTRNVVGMKPGISSSYERTFNGRFLTILYLGSGVMLLLCSLACIIALHRNAQIMQQNLEHLQAQVKVQEKCLKVQMNFTVLGKKFDDDYGEIDLTELEPSYKFRLRRSNVEIPKECPPCPTEAPPIPVDPYRNPVSVLNEKFPGRTTYLTVFTCEDPPVHQATLTIDDHNLDGKSWNGKGKSIQHAKQAAAWNAIQQNFPELKGEVSDEYIPLPHNPICHRPPSSHHRFYKLL